MVGVECDDDHQSLPLDPEKRKHSKQVDRLIPLSREQKLKKFAKIEFINHIYLFKESSSIDDFFTNCITTMPTWWLQSRVNPKVMMPFLICTSYKANFLSSDAHWRRHFHQSNKCSPAPTNTINPNHISKVVCHFTTKSYHQITTLFLCTSSSGYRIFG